MADGSAIRSLYKLPVTQRLGQGNAYHYSLYGLCIAVRVRIEPLQCDAMRVRVGNQDRAMTADDYSARSNYPLVVTQQDRRTDFLKPRLTGKSRAARGAAARKH